MKLNDNQTIERLEGVIRLSNQYADNEGISRHVVIDALVDLKLDLEETFYIQENE